MDTSPYDVPTGFISAAQYTDLLLKYRALQNEFRDYRKDAEERAMKAAVKMREAKRSIKEWQAYTQKKGFKQAWRELNQDFATPRAQGHILETALENALDDVERPVSLAHAAVEAVRGSSVSIPHSPTQSKITSSQTTEGEAAAKSSPTGHSDDDVPVFVSTRSLKRKRDSPRKNSQAIKVKNENLSSSPLESRVFHAPLIRTETSDLDTLARRLRPVNQDVPLNDQVRGAVSYPAPDQEQNLLRTPAATRQAGNGASDNESADDISDAGAAHREESQESGSTIKTVKMEPDTRTGPAAKERTLLRTTSKSFGPCDPIPTNGPLHNVSPNTPTLPRTSAAPVTSGKKLDRSRGARAVHVLSEDGDDVALGFKKPRLFTDQATPKSSGPSRLDQLLDGSSPQIDRTILSPRSAPGIRRHREVISPVTSRSAEKPISRVTRTMRDKPSPRITALPKDEDDEDPGPVLPEHEPLRSRPLHRLKLEDFKINPKFSNQLGYAYRETVRKRAERRCLPGCTREECCGAIRRFIAAGGLPADTALTDDELTLQGYLGSAYAQTIHKASTQEREQMLIEARAKAFADKHGKHRQAFERRATPPGFWRTDMPTTQELEEDREEARKMERQKVEERWRDAMRGGGRYMFRDE